MEFAIVLKEPLKGPNVGLIDVLQIASAKCRLIEADQEANQQDRECDVRDRRDDRSAVDPGESRVQELLEIKHGYWTPGCKTWLPVDWSVAA